jgi:branched-chain amino acid transport system permease protein
MYDRKLSQKKTLTALVGLLVVLGLLVLLSETGLITNYYAGIINQSFYTILMVTSLNIATGFLGQIALGHAGFMAVGAYSSALLTKYMIKVGAFSATDTSGLLLFLLAIVFGALMAAVFGMIVGVPALRLRGDYLAIITLGFGEIIRVIIQNLKFAGGKGLSEGSAGQALIGIARFNKVYVIFVVTVLCVAFLFAFVRSKYGRAITSIRDDEIAAASIGLNTTYYKVLAFTISAAIAGVAGAVFAHRGLGTIQHGDFTFIKSTEYVIMVIMGGMGSLSGSVVAAIVLSVIPETLRAFAEYRMIVYSVLLILMMIFKPTGLFGRSEFSLHGFIKGLPHLREHMSKRRKKPKENDGEGGEANA